MRLVPHSRLGAGGQKGAHHKLIQACLVPVPAGLSCCVLGRVYGRMRLVQQGANFQSSHCQGGQHQDWSCIQWQPAVCFGRVGEGMYRALRAGF